MKLSVIVPCYNEAKKYPANIKKIRKCDKKDVEILLVNNGSQDNSQDVLDDLIPIYSFARQ